MATPRPASRGTSVAVMARRSEPADSLDFFPTPPWGTRTFCEHLLPRFEMRDAVAGVYPVDALDPCCGEGHMALALREYFSLVTATDVHDYGFGGRGDFTDPAEIYAPRDWVIMNPPFNRGVDFVRRALQVARRGVAALVRTAFLEGDERQDTLFCPHPPAVIGQFVERLPMHRGRWVVNGKSATAYCWIVWHTHQPKGEPRFTWLPKSRRTLTRHDDWLRFGGCQDLPLSHASRRVPAAAQPAAPPLLAEENGRANVPDGRSPLRPAADRAPAADAMAELRAELGALL